MQKMKKVPTTKLAEIEAASCGDIKFRVVNDIVVSIEFPTPLGPLFVEVGSYNVSVNELETKKQFWLGFFTEVADDKIFVEKTFDSAQERQDYIRKWCHTIPEEELSMQDREIYA